MFRKFHSKSDMTHAYECTVRFLDDAEPLKVTYQHESSGQWLLDHVCKELNLLEKDYFGLRYIDQENQRHWLDVIKPIHKQLKGSSEKVLCFRVKFYPADPLKLHEELTRYMLFLQVRRDLHHGRMLCNASEANLLAALIIQSEVGDYDPADHAPGYVANFKMLPKQTDTMEDKIAELHRTLAGKVPEEVEKEFLTKVMSLETYGVDPHSVKDQKGEQMYLGITHMGVMSFRGSSKTHHFPWENIVRIAYDGKMFILHVIIEEGRNGSVGTTAKKRKHVVGFKCDSVASCKHLWKCAIEQQSFFTLTSASQAKKVKSGGIFHRNSKYRFSGRCQKEIMGDTINRPEPKINRSLSNPSFLKAYKKISHQSLPANISSNTKEDNVLVQFYDQLVASTPDHSADQSNLDSTLETTTTIPEDKEVTIADGAVYSPNLSSEKNDEPVEMEISRILLHDEGKDSTPLVNHLNETMETSESEAMTTALDGNHAKGFDDSTADSLDGKIDGGRKLSCFGAFAISILLTLLLAVVALYILFELDIESGFVDDLRVMDPVATFRQDVYTPAKMYVQEKVAGILS